MKKSFCFIGCLVFLQPVFADQFDFRHSKQSGKIVVVDNFNEIGKSNISIESIAALLRENERLTKENKSYMRELERLKSQVNKLDDRLKSLERKIK